MNVQQPEMPENVDNGRRKVLRAAPLLLIGLLLAACGKRADVEAPPDAPKARTYPKPR